MPAAPGSPNPNPDPSVLTQGIAGPTTTGPSPQDLVQEYMKQVQLLHAAIDTLAGQHPEAAEQLNQAKQALTDSMTPVAANMIQANPAQPATF